MKVGSIPLTIIDGKGLSNGYFKIEKLNRKSEVDWTTKVDDFEAYILATDTELGIKLHDQFQNDEIDEQTFYRELFFIIHNEVFEK